MFRHLIFSLDHLHSGIYHKLLHLTHMSEGRRHQGFGLMSVQLASCFITCAIVILSIVAICYVLYKLFQLINKCFKLKSSKSYAKNTPSSVYDQDLGYGEDYSYKRVDFSQKSENTAVVDSHRYQNWTDVKSDENYNLNNCP